MGNTAYRITLVTTNEQSAQDLVAGLVGDGEVIDLTFERVDEDWVEDIEIEVSPLDRTDGAVTGLDIANLIGLFGGDLTESAQDFLDALGGKVVATGLTLAQALSLYRQRQQAIFKGEDPDT
jgi:hypothetical protein